MFDHQFCGILGQAELLRGFLLFQLDSFNFEMIHFVQFETIFISNFPVAGSVGGLPGQIRWQIF
jgi:hypothetical protein